MSVTTTQTPNEMAAAIIERAKLRAEIDMQRRKNNALKRQNRKK